MVLAVNTSNTVTSSSTSNVIALTTTVANCWIAVIVKTTFLPTTCTISDTGLLTWNVTASPPTGTWASGGWLYKVFYALMPTAGSTTITVNFTGVTGSCRTEVVAVSGADLTTPFDVNANAASLAQSSGSTSSLSTTALSTTNANTLMILCMNNDSGLGTVGRPSGFTQVNATGTAMDACYQIFSATQSGITPTYTYSSAGTNQALSAFTFQAAGGASLSAGTASSSAHGALTATVTVANASGGTPTYTYQWYRSTSNGFTPGGGNIVAGATSQTLNDTGLTPGTTYYYVNVVTDSAGSPATANSNQVTVVMNAALTSGTASTTSAGSTIATVTCGAATNGKSSYTYQWYRSTSNGFTPGGGNIVAGATSLTLNDTGLTNNTTYYYKLVSTDAESTTVTSNQISATPMPAALASGTASTSSVGNTIATVTVANATGGTSPYAYQWYRSTSNGFTPGAGNKLTGATSQTLNDTGLTNGTTYYYVNIATDSASATATSNQVSATPVASLTAGTATASGTGSTTATATVAAATGGTAPYTYQWYRSTTINFTPGAGNIVSGATSLTLNDTGLTAGTTYYYKNVVTDNVSATAISTQVSALPFNVLVRGVASISSKTATSITLTCTAASGGTGTITYQWYRSLFPDSGFTAVAGATSRTSLADTVLTTGTPYFYYCQAMDSASITPSNTVGEIPPKTVFLGFIGDSWNTTTTSSGGASGTLAQCAASLCPQKLQALFTDGTIITASNAGVGGTNGNDWAPGGTDLNAAESQFNGVHSTHSDWIIQCHLGINDSSQNFSSPSGGESPAQYYAYMNAIANELINVWGCGKLVFVAPPYIIDGAAGGTNHTTAGVQRLYEYQAQLQLVANNYPGKCFANLAQFNYFLNAWSTDLGSDNVHPTFTDANGAGGATNVSTIWATYLYQAITGKFIGSGGGGGSRAMRMGI